MEPKRLNKFISDSGFCSRRDADKLIEQGRVTVNGKLAEAGTKITAKDKVRIDDELLQVRDEAPVFLVFNKPAGIATTTDPNVKNNMIRALNYPASLSPIGYLDREAEGLIFLSNDTELARKMTRADTKFEKEYVVTVDKIIAADFLNKLSEAGAPSRGEARKRSTVTKEGTSRFRIVLEPGQNHHIKRICEDLGYQVVHLQRVRIHTITAAKLRTGYWRILTDPEIEALKSILTMRAGKAKAARQEAEEMYEEGLPSRPRQTGRSTGRPSRTSAPARGSKVTKSTTKTAGASGRKSGTRNGSAPDRNRTPKGEGSNGRAPKRTVKK
jgi:23S rRNA pseudouridine2604 synthase